MINFKYILIAFLLVSITAKAQEENTRWKVASVELVPAAFGIYDNDFAFGGGLGITIQKNKHHFKAAINAVVDPILSSENGFSSFELLYGRDFDLGNTWSLYTFLGVGYVSIDEVLINEETIGIPLNIYVKKKDKRFVVTPNIYINFNEFRTAATLGILLQYNFK